MKLAVRGKFSFITAVVAVQLFVFSDYFGSGGGGGDFVPVPHLRNPSVSWVPPPHSTTWLPHNVSAVAAI